MDTRVSGKSACSMDWHKSGSAFSSVMIRVKAGGGAMMDNFQLRHRPAVTL